MYDRLVCEHEAAHAVVARELGLTVAEVRADQPDDRAGYCRWRPDWQRPVEQLAVTVAPEIWTTQLRRDVFGDLADDGCHDDRVAVTRRLTELGMRSLDERLATRRVAEQMAMEALRDRFDDIVTIAGRLQRYGVWTSGGGWRGYVSPEEQLKRDRAQALEESIPGPRYSPEPVGPAAAISRPVVAAPEPRHLPPPPVSSEMRGKLVHALMGVRDPLVAGVVRNLLAVGRG